MTFKDLKKRVTLAEKTTTQQQFKRFERLLNKPFWIWDIAEHKQEDIRTKGDCCFNHTILYLYKYIMVLTRDEKERLVLNLYNRRTPIREIAREAGMSFRDIGRIIDKKEKEKEAMEGQTRGIHIDPSLRSLFTR